MPMTYGIPQVLEPAKEVSSVQLYRVTIDAEREVVQYGYRALGADGTVVDTRSAEVPWETIQAENPRVFKAVYGAVKEDGYRRAPFPRGTVL